MADEMYTFEVTVGKRRAPKTSEGGGNTKKGGSRRSLGSYDETIQLINALEDAYIRSKMDGMSTTATCGERSLLA